MSNILLRRRLYYTTAAAAAAAAATTLALTHTHPRAGNIMRTTTTTPPQPSPTYTATFSVPLTCTACTTAVAAALSPLPGIKTTTYSIPGKTLTATADSATPPSAIISAIQSTGRSAILRGSGAPNSAAVCILELPSPVSTAGAETESPVRGLARLIELGGKSGGGAAGSTLLDVTLTGLPAGRYAASLRERGDISGGKASMGAVFRGLGGDKRGELGEVVVGEGGKGGLVGEVGWRVWEMVGRGVVVEKVGREAGGGEGVVVGVVARSAGGWENEKVVCGCSGKTVWEEREEMVGRGMV